MSEKITAADAIRLLDAHEAAAVDVREPDEFAVGHIPGAKLLPLGQVLSRAAEVLPDKNAVLPHRPPQCRCRAQAGKPWLHPPVRSGRHPELAL